MTRHDKVRMEEALRCNPDDVESLRDAVCALQSTDDPSLGPLHDRLLKRLFELKEQQAK